jgi:hypothetical protein
VNATRSVTSPTSVQTAPGGSQLAARRPGLPGERLPGQQCGRVSSTMHDIIRIPTQEEFLARDLDRLTRRLQAIAKDSSIDYPGARARSLCECAIISLWAHETRPTAKAALNRLMRALESVT